VSALQTVVVTGADGFVGRHLVRELLDRGGQVRAVSRRGALPKHPRLEVLTTPDIVDAPWPQLLNGARAVVHLAAIAHRGAPRDAAQVQRLRAVNVEAVARLARSAGAGGVARLVLVSSVGVLGSSSGTRSFDADSRPAPHDDYSASKLEAEHAAAEASATSGLQLCVLRPPLVFGPDAPGNFPQLLTAIRRGLPLPLGAIANRRSFLSIWNLCDLIATCLSHPQAAQRPWLAADSGTLSSAELVRLCAGYLGAPARLWRVPVSALRLAAAALGRRADFTRLCGDLVVDDRLTRQTLQWQPPLTLEEGLRRSCQP
jgi:nucleoside-diphosphate-sugar epimerase